MLSWHAQVGMLEFSRERKMMSVRCRREGQDTLFLKGAPEAVLPRCTQARSCPTLYSAWPIIVGLEARALR